MKSNKQVGHQGDVQFRTVNQLPKGAKAINHKPIALGEHSGHEHIVTGDVELFEFEGTVYAAVGSDGATLQHTHESHFSGNWNMKGLLPIADHKPITLAPNTVVELWIQQSYNPYKRIMEAVED